MKNIILIFIFSTFMYSNFIYLIDLNCKTFVEYSVKTELENNSENDTDDKDSNFNSNDEFETCLFKIDISLFSLEHLYNKFLIKNYSLIKIFEVDKPPKLMA